MPTPEEFTQYLKTTASIVATWPEWKQNLLGGIPPKNMTDAEIITWVESCRGIEIRWREYLPDNKKTDRPWWVCVDGNVPQVGRSFREAVIKARTMLERKARRNG